MLVTKEEGREGHTCSSSLMLTLSHVHGVCICKGGIVGGGGFEVIQRHHAPGGHCLALYTMATKEGAFAATVARVCSMCKDNQLEQTVS